MSLVWTVKEVRQGQAPCRCRHCSSQAPLCLQGTSWLRVPTGGNQWQMGTAAWGQGTDQFFFCESFLSRIFRLETETVPLTPPCIRGCWVGWSQQSRVMPLRLGVSRAVPSFAGGAKGVCEAPPLFSSPGMAGTARVPSGGTCPEPECCIVQSWGGQGHSPPVPQASAHRSFSLAFPRWRSQGRTAPLRVP